MNSPAATQIELRQAGYGDIEAIHALLNSYSDSGNLLPRTTADIEKNLTEFSVIVDDHRIVGCSALEVFTSELGEVRSLAVSQNRTHHGMGSLLVAHIVQQARECGLKRLMALTYAPGFFYRLGFETVPKDTLPEKVWGVCIKCYKFRRCDEIAVLLQL